MTVKYTTKMRLEHFHDFYFLQALKAGIASEISLNPEKAFSRSVEKLEMDLNETMEEIIPNMALRTFVYLYAACLGEARHARESVAKFRYMPCLSQLHRQGVYKMITDYRPTKQNLDTLVHIFSQDWRSGFGGRAWEKIAKALKMYFTDPPAAFIDHVIDLEHNGGTAFNKTESKDTLGFIAWYPDRLSCFLDYKFEKNILEVGPGFTLTLNVTLKVYNLVNRYTSIFGKKRVDWIAPKLDKLSFYMIQWGDEVMSEEEKWCEWADCSYGNRPSVTHIMEKIGLDEIYPGNFFEAELKEKAQTIKTKSFELAGKFLDAKLKSQILRKVSHWLKWAVQNAKVEKKSITYQALPVKIVSSNQLEILVPFDGYGLETPNGFLCEINIHYPIKPSDGHIMMEDGQLYLYANQTQLAFTDKQLEAFVE